jgi:hypothetical protein
MLRVLIHPFTHHTPTAIYIHIVLSQDGSIRITRNIHPAIRILHLSRESVSNASTTEAHEHISIGEPGNDIYEEYSPKIE